MLRETRLSWLVGLLMVVALTFDLDRPIIALGLLLTAEAFTPVRPTALLSNSEWLWADLGREGGPIARLVSAERAWRLAIVAVLLVGWLFPRGALWYVPWFLSLAMIGAGASGICPLFASLRWSGLR